MTGSNIIIREYKEGDMERVIDVVGKTLAREKVVSCGELPLDDEDLTDIPLFYGGKSRFWVAEQNGTVVGTVAIKDKGDGIVKLRRMFVLHNLHGTGIGQQLLDTAFNYVQEQRFKKIVLNTHPFMKRAHRFY